MSTYIESLGKLQQQSLDALKQAQATQLAALTTIGQIVADVPAFKPGAAFENLPTFAELADLNAAFARNILEQQSAYASQLAGVFTATQQNVTKVAERVVATAASSTK
jgi:hypothetical protein